MEIPQKPIPTETTPAIPVQAPQPIVERKQLTPLEQQVKKEQLQKLIGKIRKI